MKKLKRHLDESKRVLRLSHWEIEISPEPTEDKEDYANIDPDDRAFKATLRLGDLFWSASEQVQNETIAHELAHLHAYDLTNYVGDLKKHVPPALWDHFWSEFERKEDRMIEELARLFVRLLPRLPLMRRERKK